MSKKKAFTLFEIIVVLIIVGVVIALTLPNFTNPTEQAKAQTAQNNLLAIYTAQQNYRNNNNSYCTGSCLSIYNINSNLNLGIQNDGNYNYACFAGSGANPPTCTATRNDGSKAPGDFYMVEILNQPTGATNPSCDTTVASKASWCPGNANILTGGGCKINCSSPPSSDQSTS